MKRMKIKAKEFKFNGNKIGTRPIEYTIHWENLLADTIVIMSRGSDRLILSGREIPKFIKELQTLAEFMKNDGLIPIEDAEEGEEDEDRGCGSDHQPG